MESITNAVRLMSYKLTNKKAKFDLLQTDTLPRKGLFNIINICNANCVFCAYQFKKDKPMIMTLEFFKECVRQFSEFQPKSWITLSPTVGDPLLDKDLFKKIEIAKLMGVKEVQFFTNAILLKKNVDRILASNLDILEISFPDFNRQEYEIIFRTDKYEDSLEGIHSLLKKHQETKSNLKVEIGLRPRRSLRQIVHENDFKKFIKPFLSKKVKLTIAKCYDNWTGLIKQASLPQGMKLSKDHKKRYGLPCRKLFDVMFLSTGDIKLCGCRFNGTVFDELVIGNLHTSSLRDIWFNQKAFEIRKSFFTKEFPSVCRNCSLYLPCKF